MLDRMVALTATMIPAASQAEEMLTLVETFADGWWYSAHLSGPHIDVALMSDTDLVKRHGWRDTTRWWDLLRQ